MRNYGIAKKTIVPIRKEPEEKGLYIDELLLGMVVEILWEDKNNYVFIQTQYDYKGYVQMEDLFLDSRASKKWKDSIDIVVMGSYVDITEDTSFASGILTSAVRGSYLVGCCKEKSNRIKVKLPDGRAGWVRKKHIKVRKRLDFNLCEMEIRTNIVEYALLYLYTQFRWGGKSPLGIDSSGLTCMAYLLNEIVIWRDSQFLQEHFVEISPRDIKKGDVLFFPEHTAIYIGNNRFIHSSGIDSGVVIHSLDPKDDDYKEALAATLTKVGKYVKFK
ncbi:MAG: C40 family peptidase [Maledivibacter sp.]|jgi:beta-lactamase class A|nr:C40 family peptidase [Maledivibacter sp.]